MSGQVLSAHVLDLVLSLCDAPASERFHDRLSWIGHYARVEGLTLEQLVSSDEWRDPANGNALSASVGALHLPLTPRAELAVRIAEEFPDFEEHMKVEQRRIIIAGLAQIAAAGAA
ncbi:hypothetical protein [Rhodococcus ruber]|uniref:hypothetical protein n=1 Tax=Rhodococcus ruber TaxID=1830 RepID=UPI0037850471